MRPRIDEALAKKIAASAPPAGNAAATKAEPKTEKKESPPPASAKPTKKPATLPGQVDLYVEIVTSEDRQVPAWAFIRDEDHATLAIIIALNRHHWRMQRSLEKSGSDTVKLLAGFGLAECLQRNKPLCECIRKQVVPKNLQHVHGVLFLGSVLAQSNFLAQIASLPIYGELAEPVGNSYLIATVHPDSLKTSEPREHDDCKMTAEDLQNVAGLS